MGISVVVVIVVVGAAVVSAVVGADVMAVTADKREVVVFTPDAVVSVDWMVVVMAVVVDCGVLILVVG